MSQWEHLANCVENNRETQFPITIAHQLYQELLHEKRSREVDQIVARMRYMSCFLNEGQHIQKKFALLARYYYCIGERDCAKQVIISSFVREWPTEISENGSSDSPVGNYEWDRAPFYVELKEDGQRVRKEHSKYHIRCLALDKSNRDAFGLESAISHTYVRQFGSNEKHSEVTLFELTKEGSKAGSSAKKRSATEPLQRAYRESGKRDTDDHKQKESDESYFTCGFEKLPVDGKKVTIYFPHTRTEDDFSDPVFQFTIKNLCLNTTTRAATTEYTLETVVLLEFSNLPAVRVGTKNHADAPGIFSMPFQATKNDSTHWKKIFPLIWKELYRYHSLRQETDAYIQQCDIKRFKENSQENVLFLPWGRVKLFLAGYLSFLADTHIRELSDSEIRTIATMILRTRLKQFLINEKQSKRQMLPATREEQKKIEIYFFGKALSDDRFTTDRFLSRLEDCFYRRPLSDKFAIFESDFTDLCPSNIPSPKSPLPEGSFSVYTWLQAVANILDGPVLHPGTYTARMFNNYHLSLRNSVSSESLIRTCLEEEKKKTQPENVLMIRFDEREEGAICFEFADHAHGRCFFGREYAAMIKEYRLRVEASKPYWNELKDGWVFTNKKSKQVYGLLAFLLKGYCFRYTKIVKLQPEKTQRLNKTTDTNIPPTEKRRNILTTNIFSVSDNEQCHPLYGFVLKPIAMLPNEIVPNAGPAPLPPSSTRVNDEVVPVPKSVFSQATTASRQISTNVPAEMRVTQNGMAHLSITGQADPNNGRTAAIGNSSTPQRQAIQVLSPHVVSPYVQPPPTFQPQMQQPLFYTSTGYDNPAMDPRNFSPPGNGYQIAPQDSNYIEM